MAASRLLPVLNTNCGDAALPATDAEYAGMTNIILPGLLVKFS